MKQNKRGIYTVKVLFTWEKLLNFHVHSAIQFGHIALFINGKRIKLSAFRIISSDSYAVTFDINTEIKSVK